VARLTWDPQKARTNLRDHKVSFELAMRIFEDPMVASRRDPYPDEVRWQSIGKPSSDSFIVLFVVHTDPVPQPGGEEEGRIVSARRATSHERVAYEEGEF
jgi:uncharacterized DUF497 family protein